MKKTWMITGLLLLTTGMMMTVNIDASMMDSSKASGKQEVQWAPPPPKKKPTKEEIRESYKRGAERRAAWQREQKRQMDIVTNPTGHEAMKERYHDEGRARYEAEKNKREALARLSDLLGGSSSDDEYDYGYDRSYYKRKHSTSPQAGDYAQRVLDACNRERARVGVPPLHLSPVLQKAAVIRAEEITRRMSHTRPNGQSCQSVFPPDVRAYRGENIAAGLATPEETVQDWMNSSGHRRNILDPNYRELGVGFYYLPGSEYQYYWVQIFTS